MSRTKKDRRCVNTPVFFSIKIRPWLFLAKCSHTRLGHFLIGLDRSARNTYGADDASLGRERDAARENDQLAMIARLDAEQRLARLRRRTQVPS